MRQDLFVVALTIFSSGHCASQPLWNDVCSSADNSDGHDDDGQDGGPYLFCNKELSLSERVDDYVRRIPTTSKIDMMGNAAKGYSPLNIPPYQWWSEGLHGPLEPCVTFQNQCRCPTSFPSPSVLGNTFNASLFHLIGQTIGIEGRAISSLRPHDLGIGDGLTYWSPTINLQRDPRWGRNQEVPGEDPLLTSVYARQFVDGLQGSGRGNGGETADESDPSSTTTIRVGAACKHFVANSLEDWNNVTRHGFDAHIDHQDMYNYYFPPFQECSKAAVGIMCSYNAINGIPACVNPWLLKDVLRDEFNFDGYLVTDCGALGDVVHGHHYAIDAAQSAALAKNATVDINCGNGEFFPSGLQQAYSDGRIDSKMIEESFARMATIQFRLGLFDGPKSFEPDKEIELIGSQQHQQIALDAALQGVVLLENKNQLLPLVGLDKKSTSREKDVRLAVIGPHTNATEALLSNYHGEKCQCETNNRISNFGVDPSHETAGMFGSVLHSWDCLTTPLGAIQQKIKQLYPNEETVESLAGCNIANDKLDEVEAARELASRSETVIMMLGIDNGQESEGRDRYETTLPGLQTRLLDAVLDVAADRTVIVLIHGGSMSLGQDVLGKAGAIISAGYGGEMGSEAIASVLFGDYNPTGKLSATWYPPSFVDDIPLTEMGLRVGVGRTYMYYKKQAEFLFGHGLSYSSWKMRWDDENGIYGQELMLDENISTSIKLRLKIENLGPYPGQQTVLIFWHPNMPNTPSSHEGLQKKLIAFSGTTEVLGVGETESMEFNIGWKDFALWDPNEEKFVVSPGRYILEVQIAANSERLTRPLQIRTIAKPGTHFNSHTQEEEYDDDDSTTDEENVESTMFSTVTKPSAFLVQTLQMAMRLLWRN